MIPPILGEYEKTLRALATAILAELPDLKIGYVGLNVPIYRLYDDRQAVGKLGEFEAGASSLVAAVPRAGSLAVVPVALYMEGEIMASVGLGGGVGRSVRDEMLEGLFLRDGRWVYLGRRTLPSGRFPTYDLLALVLKALNPAHRDE